MLSNYPLVALVATEQPEQAKVFYRDSLGLRLVRETPFALVFDAGGTMLRVTVVEHRAPAQYTVLGWNVPDIRNAIAGLASNSVSFVRYDTLEQDDLGIWTSPDGSRVAWFQDPDGNTLSLTQFR